MRSQNSNTRYPSAGATPASLPRPVTCSTVTPGGAPSAKAAAAAALRVPAPSEPPKMETTCCSGSIAYAARASSRVVVAKAGSTGRPMTR